MQTTLKFIGIGLLNTGFYLAITWALNATTKLDVKVINVVAYFVCMVLSYIGHRKVTFRSQNKIHHEAWRFVVTNIVNLLASTVLLLIVQRVGLNRYIATTLAATMIMASSFVMMQIWVFKDRSDNRPRSGTA